MQPIPRRNFLVFLLLLGLVWIGIRRAAPGEAAASLVPAPQTGFPAPDFTLETIDGQTVTLSSLRGKPVILNFWASWCPPCKAEMPAIQHVYADYRERGLVVLAVNAANQDTLANIQAFLNKNSLAFPVPLDTAGTVNTLYKVRSLPTTFFIGADGVIREIVIGGPMTEAALRLRADSLLEDMP